MRQYKVIALSVGGRANKIFSAGDMVNEDQFIPGRSEELVEQGFLQRTGEIPGTVKESSDDIEVEVTQKEVPAEEPTSESLLDSLKNSLGQPSKETPTIDSISRKDITKTLTELGIPFEATASKKELFDLWLAKDNY
jgi:hypothetical protein